MWDEISCPFSNYNSYTVEVISSYAELFMWLLIHAGIKVNPC